MTFYKDGPNTSVEVLISAPVDEVWALISDPSLPERFSSELQEAGWGEHPSGEPGVGSTIIGHNHNDSRGAWTSTSFVTEWDPNEAFTWAVKNLENPAATWGFQLEEKGQQTVLRQRYLIGPGPSGVSDVIDAAPDREEAIIAGRLKAQAANMLKTLNAVKAILEPTTVDPVTWYTTLPQRSVDLLINASPAEVWALVIDPTGPSDASEELDSAVWGEHPSGEPGLGSTIIGHSSREGYGDWTTTSWVTEWDPERRFTWVVHDLENPIATWQFDIDEVGVQTRLTQQVTLGPGESAISRAVRDRPEKEEKIIDRRLTYQAENMMRNLEAIKAKLED